MDDRQYGLYLLQDGTHADPAACSRGKDGVLRHENGLAVCLYEDGTPQTVGADAERNKNVEAASAGVAAEAAAAAASEPKPAIAEAPKPAVVNPAAAKPAVPAAPANPVAPKRPARR